MKKGISMSVRVFAAMLAIALLAVPFVMAPVVMAAVSAGVLMLFIVTTRSKTADARAGPSNRNLHNERRYNLINGVCGGPYVATSGRSKKAERRASRSMLNNSSYQNRLSAYINGGPQRANSVTARLNSMIRRTCHHIIGRARGSCRHLFHRESATLSLGYG